MKKTLAVLLALAMLICTLTACGNNGNAANSPSNAPSGTNSSDAPGGDAGIYDKLELTTATSYNETDFNGSLIKWFGDYLNEKSGGAVTLKCYYGGAFCQDAEVYDYVMSGDMNLSFVQPVYAMTYFPYAFGIASGISDENCMTTANGLIYDNPETAALIEEQGAANNLHLLAHTCAGSSVFLCKKEITSFKDASQYTIGSPINLEIYAGYGFGTVAVEPADMYDSLSRGVCDVIAYAAPNILSQNLYEVANNVGDPRAYFTNQIICVNNDVWKSLNADTQALLIEAALAVSEYSIGAVQELQKELYDEKIPESGGTYHLFTEEEGMDFNHRSMKTTADLIRGFAANLGCSDGMEVVIQAWADGLGQEGF